MTGMNNSTLKQEVLNIAKALDDISCGLISELKDNAGAVIILRLAVERIPEDGWVIVPEEPTENMRSVGLREAKTAAPHGSSTRIYCAMIAARPEDR